MNGGYYCIGCRGCGIVNIEYVDVTGGNEQNVNDDVSTSDYWKILKRIGVVLLNLIRRAILIRTSLSLESLCYPEYCSYEDCDLSCDESGYVRYVSKWYKNMKCGSCDDVFGAGGVDENTLGNPFVRLITIV